jgi:hypothetical protein
MARIFLGLATLDGLALLVTFGVGLLSMFRGSLNNPSDPTYFVHFALGLTTVLLNLAVHCLIFIYFLGTGRLVKEIALAYELPDRPLPYLTRELKRKTFPVALLAMLVSIATAAAGMGVQMSQWPWYVHLSLAVATLLINGWAFVVEYRNVRINTGVLDQVYHEVDRIRAALGLPTNAEALRREEL